MIERKPAHNFKAELCGKLGSDIIGFVRYAMLVTHITQECLVLSTKPHVVLLLNLGVSAFDEGATEHMLLSARWIRDSYVDNGDCRLLAVVFMFLSKCLLIFCMPATVTKRHTHNVTASICLFPALQRS